MPTLPAPATAADYAAILRDLLPKGRIWPTTGSSDSRMDLLTQALAEELARLHGRVYDVDPLTGAESGAMAESLPSSAVDTLGLWETELGLEPPDPADTTAIRQARAHARYIATGGDTAAYFIGLAAAAGVTVTIANPGFTPWKACTKACYPLYPTSAVFTWAVTGPAATTARMRYIISQLFNKYKPLHTRIVFYWV